MSSQIFLNDSTISNKHFRIYSVIYDPNSAEVEPLIYAEDLSTNGSRWLPKLQCSEKPYTIGRSNAFLLSDGDRILSSDGTKFTFISRSSIGEVSLKQEANEIQELEKKVSYFFKAGRFQY